MGFGTRGSSLKSSSTFLWAPTLGVCPFCPRLSASSCSGCYSHPFVITCQPDVAHNMPPPSWSPTELPFQSKNFGKFSQPWIYPDRDEPCMLRWRERSFSPNAIEAKEEPKQWMTGPDLCVRSVRQHCSGQILEGRDWICWRSNPFFPLPISAPLLQKEASTPSLSASLPFLPLFHPPSLPLTLSLSLSLPLPYRGFSRPWTPVMSSHPFAPEGI